MRAAFAACGLALALAGAPKSALAACGATDRTWAPPGGQTGWSQSAGWGGNLPDTSAENAIIRSAGGTPNSDITVSIGCLDVQSGFLNTTTGVTLSITGDYFQNPTAGALTVAAGSTWTVVMAGTAAQTFENQDTINYLTISNNTSVTFNRAFAIRNTLSVTGTGTTVYANANLSLQDAAAPLVIGSGKTLEVGSGATLTALGGISVYGTLKLNPGASLEIGSGKTVQVFSGGLLDLAGASGNVATLKGYQNNSYNVVIDSGGYLNGSYFRVNHLASAGIQVSGTVQNLNNGEFHYFAGSALTLNSGATVPSTMTGLGFFDDAGAGGRKNFNATSYTCGGSARQVNDWSGDVGGAANETDPSACIDWGTQAGTRLTLSDATASGSPPATVGQSSGPTYFATFAFALTQTDTATNITEVTITNNGTASSADIDYIQVYKEVGTNCSYDAGVDTQIGANLSVSGSPPSVTVTIPSGDVQTSGTTPACIHVLVRTTSTAQDDRTISMQISATDDVTNSQGYSFSDTSGPPVSAASSTIVGSALSTWNGRQTTSWSTANNWIEATVPSSTRDCKIGSGDRITALNANGACQNTTLQAGGTLDFQSTTRELAVYGSLDVDSSFTFSNAASGTIAMRGAGSQSLVPISFPGNLVIANTGGAGSNYVNLDANSSISGSVTVSSGVLRISSGITLTVSGNVTVASGATLDIDPGATLVLGNGSVVTINSGGTLEMVGSSSQSATMTSNATTSAYAVVVNGTIKAQYYTFSRLGTNGVTINSGATIDTTYHLQNGSFTYPVNNSSTFLRLYRQVPTDTMNGCTFDAAGSSATGITNIYTDSAIASDGSNTLTLNSYTGSWAGSAYDADAAAYAISWASPTNTLDLTQEATGPASVNQSQTYNMGRFGFKQTLAGASYSDTDITSLKLTMTGTGTASDVTAVRIYFDSACSGSGGVLIGTGSFSGSPGTKTFSISTGSARIPASATSPPKRCIYVEYDISADAVGGNTLGVKINASGDVVNSQSYAISGSTPPPVDLGTAATVVATTTTWTGAVSTNWFTAGNWNNGVPTSTWNCKINSATNNPVIGAAGAVCKTVTIGTGTLTMTNGAGATLDAYGDFTNNGTFNQNDGVVRLADNGSTATNQTVTSNSGLASLTFNKTAGGTATTYGASPSISSLTLPSGSNFEFRVRNGQTLTLATGATISGGTFTVESGGTVAVANGQTIAVSGGTFRTTGLHDVYAPESGTQNQSSKGKVTVSGSGRWGFLATSGTVSLTGFTLDYLDVNGLRITGSTTLSNLKGGQFTHLSQDFTTPVKAIQLNTTGSVPATASDVGFMWDDANSYRDEAGWCNCGPATTNNYYLVYAPACGGGTISFDQWFGDFFVNNNQPLTEDKIYDTDDVGPTCQVSMAASASPVALIAMQATGYDGAVSVDWTTGSELDHSGFNVYRSLRPDGGFVQVNRGLIRNFSSSALGRGVYRFVDQSVTNGTQYYYALEDVAINGTRTWHGSVSATPRAGAGSVPSTGTGTNTGTPGSGTDSGTPLPDGSVGSPGVIQLGNGVRILSKTRHSLRLEIAVPSPDFGASTWDPTYDTVSMAGYSATLEPGQPELLSRTVLVEVDADLENAVLSGSAVSETATSAHRIAPAPDWLPDSSGVLVPSWSLSSAAYAQDSFVPGAYFTLDAATKGVSGRRYVKIDVTPVRYNPVRSEVKSASRIILDIGLNGAAWSDSPDPTVPQLSPSAGEGNLRIRYPRTGMYQLTYEDLAGAFVEGPFAGGDVSRFRLYHLGAELPMEVISATGMFSPGDAIRFYAIHNRSAEDDENEVVLSRWAFFGEGTAPLRILPLAADPSGYPVSDERGTLRTAASESDQYAMFDAPLGSAVDHFYWAKLWAEQGQPAGPEATLSMPVDLPGILRDYGDTVRMRLHVKGGSAYAMNARHHVGVYVNQVPFQVADGAFDGLDPTVLTLDIPAQFFVDGANTLRVQVLADLVPAGDWDIVYVDRAEFEYRAARAAVNGYAEVTNYRLDTALTVSGFADPVSVLAYDVTDVHGVRSLAYAAPFTADGGVSWNVSFAASSGPSGLIGRRFLLAESAALLRPSSLILARGSNLRLSGSELGADLLIVAPFELIAAAEELASARRAQGLRVVTAPLEQIYSEFSHGVKSSSAIRSLVRHAMTQWRAPAPRYLLLIGDATYDPRDRYGYGAPSSTMPIPLEEGLYLDFGSDNYFAVADGEAGLPALSIGRIPATDAASLSRYIAKLLEYEDGARAPSGSMARQLVFVSDADHLGEGFAAQSDGLARSAVSARSGFLTSRIDRSVSGDAGARESILDAFGQGPLAITYLGHGAEDRWAGGAVFTNSEADALSHRRLPIVVALNCLNSYFYDADPSYRGLGESLLFNPDGGAVAFWGSTTMTLPTAQIALARAFLGQLGQETRQSFHDVRLGDLILRAKHSVGYSAASADALRSYTLLGDPSMPLPAQAFERASGSTSAVTTGGSSEESSGGGFLSCGTVNPGKGGSGGAPGAGGGIEAAAVLLSMLLGWRSLRQRRSGASA